MALFFQDDLPENEKRTYARKTKVLIKDALSGLRQSLVTENPSRIIKSTFYFTLKALFVFKISCRKTALLEK